jgi:hypothetical protein
MGLVSERNVTNHMGVRIQWHNSNQLHMSAGSRCWMRWMWYRYIPSVCSICQTLRVEVSTAGLNNRANSESEISYCIHTKGSKWQWMLSLDQLKCSGCALGGRTHVTRQVVLQRANWAVISCYDNCAVSSNYKRVIFLCRILRYAFCVWVLQQ